MEGACRVTLELSLPKLRFECLVQDGSGPFQRLHRLDAPSLVYLPGDGAERALGCFGEPASHRNFARFGQAVMVPAGVPLHVRSPGLPAREMIIVRFDAAQFGELTGIGPRSAAQELAACVDVRGAAITTAMDRLAAELAHPGLARETIITGLGLIVLGELSRHFEAARGNSGKGQLAGWQVRRIEARLAEPDRAPPDLADLADLCGIGRRHLMRAWKATTGTTVMQRVEQATFARALRLLDEEDAPLKVIADACGFATQGAFGTAFRRRFAATPREWRTRRRLARSQ